MTSGSLDTKNHRFLRRIGYAWKGVRAAWKTEASFRTQGWSALAALGFLLTTRPPPIWWAIVTVISAAILAAELFNTALEALMDVVHPQLHPLIGKAKDCASGAVLVLSVGALLVFAAILWETWRV